MSTTIGRGTNTETKRLARILDEGYGPGAWHGADLKAALADVTPDVAFWRPSSARHNIAEIALHHAFYVHSVRERLLGEQIEPFVVEGEDWFPLSGQDGLSWPQVQEVLAVEQQKLAEMIAGGKAAGMRDEAERLNLVLGITCHAVYHAGQVQLLKRLHAG